MLIHTISPVRLVVVSLIAMAGLTACRKHRLDIPDMWECHQALNPDSASISKGIIGAWTWKTQQYFLTEKFTKPADKRIKVTFRADRTYTVEEESTIITQGTWGLKQEDRTAWGLDLSARSTYLYGRILLCKNKVVFHNSYMDGSNHLFTRVR